MGKELSMARTIQRQVLPDEPARVAGFDVAARYEACGAVGGDYFDYARLADGRTLVAVADVSGHNLASGMVMVAARSTLRALARVHTDAAQLFSGLAAQMHDDLQRTERFLTAAGVALRGGEGAVEYVCAGHNDLLVYRAACDRVERVASQGTILGFLPDFAYEASRIELQAGDCMLLYTDGITEAVDAAGEMFGEERLAGVFAQLAQNRTAQRVVDGIAAELEQFRGGRASDDDVTAVVIRWTGTKGGEQP
jgi:serine phosphatase RsbU (regulator of sigma subunit)